jgi:hypothetical protein
MAGTTHDERLASTHGHKLHPLWFHFSPWISEVREFTDMVNLNRSPISAEFAAAYQ